MSTLKIRVHVSLSQEDAVWDALAGKRDTRVAKFVSHKNAWNNHPASFYGVYDGA